MRELRLPALILLMALLGIGLSAAVLFAVVPPIIAPAYRGESLPRREVSTKILTVEAALGLVLSPM